MKFSKNYKEALEKYSRIKKEHAKNIAEVEKARPEAMEGKAAAEAAMRKATETGNVSEYQKAKARRDDFAERIEFLDKRISALEIKPLADEKEFSEMMRAMDREEEELLKLTDGQFMKRAYQLIEEAQDIISSYQLLSYGREKIRREIGRNTMVVEHPSTPRFLMELDRFCKACHVLHILPEDRFFASSFSDRPLTKAQKKEYEQEEAKWA